MLKTHCGRTASLAMALTAMVGLAPPAFGDDWRTLRGHVDEILTGAPPVNDECLASCQVTAVGAGGATHLGRFTRLSCVVLREDGSPEGTTEFTAANGDKLCAEVKGEPPIFGPTGLTVRGTYTFTGGTGRFSDVSGGTYFLGVITSDMPVLISPSTSGESSSTERRTGQRASGSDSGPNHGLAHRQRSAARYRL
jgi:hypothetical protein